LKTLPVGKLPGALLGEFLSRIRQDDSVVLGPAIGEDVALIRMGKKLLVAKTDPVTLATDHIGWYAVNVNANDIATLGVRPRWFLASVLLPEKSTEKDARNILDQILQACESLGITLVGGHTEITYGLTRPIVFGCMLAEEDDRPIITTSGARVSDDIVLTRGIAIEGTALLAREVGPLLVERKLSQALVKRTADLLFTPGISVLKEALIARASADVHSMHDPTEGGLATGLLEVSIAAKVGLLIEPDKIPVLPETSAVCGALGLDPMGLLASGSLIITLPPSDTPKLLSALKEAGVDAAVIGKVVAAKEGVKVRTAKGKAELPRFPRDELARFLENLESAKPKRRKKA
jgi:hydrogenase maturation factor